MSKTKQRRTNYLPFILGGAGLLILIAAAVVIQNRSEVTEVSSNLLILPPIEVDQPAPELTLKDLDGKQTSLDDFAGQVVLVNNWATWCPPCREEMPEFQAYYEQHRAEGFEIVAIEAGQPEEEVRAFVDELGLGFVILLDPENLALETFQQTSLPNTIVLDREGNMRLVWLGAINEDTLEQFLTPLLEE